MSIWFALSPILVLAFGACALMMADAFSKQHTDLALGSFVTFASAGILAIGLWIMGGVPADVAAKVAPWIVLDKFTLFFEATLCLGGAISSLLAGGYLPEHDLDRGEFYALMLLSAIGALLLAAAGDILALFIALETMSLGVYCMTAFRRTNPRSAEGALKYFLLGSFAAAILLYGGALLYGATGTTSLAGIRDALTSGQFGTPRDPSRLPTVVIAMVFILVGLAFKVSAVPFHMWTPDAYQGAPTPATAFMSVVVKGAALATMMRVMLVAFGDKASSSWASGWPPVVAGLAIATMVVANLIALRQENVKRMLAYSSIAHAGYLLVGLVASWGQGAPEVAHEGRAALLFYILQYTVTQAGAFGALILCGSKGREAVSYEDLSGLGRRHPAAALPLALFCVSLAGIPPTAGFFGKLYIFRAAVDGGFTGLAIIGLLNSALSAYYYLRVLVYLYMREPAPGAQQAIPMRSGYVTAALVLSAALLLYLGLAPGRSLEMAINAALSLG
ncbi:MAG: NADH-quinone oxidoreductase subunit N [Polyangiales bacterium]